MTPSSAKSTSSGSSSTSKRSRDDDAQLPPPQPLQGTSSLSEEAQPPRPAAKRLRPAVDRERTFANAVFTALLSTNVIITGPSATTEDEPTGNVEECLNETSSQSSCASKRSREDDSVPLPPPLASVPAFESDRLAGTRPVVKRSRPSPMPVGPDEGNVHRRELRAPVEQDARACLVYAIGTAAERTVVLGEPARRNTALGMPAERSVVLGAPAHLTAVLGTPAELTVVRGTPAQLFFAYGTPAEFTVVQGTPVQRIFAHGTRAGCTVVQGTPVQRIFAHGTPAGCTVVQGRPVQHIMAYATPAGLLEVQGTPAQRTVVKGEPAANVTSASQPPQTCPPTTQRSTHSMGRDDDQEPSTSMSKRKRETAAQGTGNEVDKGQAQDGDEAPRHSYNLRLTPVRQQRRLKEAQAPGKRRKN